MKPSSHPLPNDRTLVIREARPDDARELLDYLEAISGESDFLTFGPGEFTMTESDERDYLRKCRDSETQLYIIGLIDDALVATLNFAAGLRPRNRHCGEFGVSVRKQYWGLGIGALMVDMLIDWAKQTLIITKINLRVRTDNHRAIALYERKGFVKEGTINRDLCVNAEYFDQHWMGLQL